MREPHFWSVTDKRARASAPVTKLLLTPVSMLYRWAGARRISQTTPADAGIPVVCIGNLTLGGTGKTPITQIVRDYYTSKGLRAASLSRGYRGSLEGAHRVDPAKHTAAEVGDEPLMLAASGETWISKDRPAGACAMKADGVQLVVMDDGHQNPTLKKKLSLLVVDSACPFGNGHVFPKGPLRERVSDGLARTDGVVLMGEGDIPEAFAKFSGPVLRARLVPLAPLSPGRYVAFAGIGKPARFFDALRKQAGVDLAEGAPYPDHHMFTPYDLNFLMKLAADHNAQLVTTDKDHVRLPDEMKAKVLRSSVRAEFEDPATLATLLEKALA